MAHSRRRREVLAAVVIVAILAAGCDQGDSNEAPAASETGAPIEKMTGVSTEDRCDLGFNTARFNETTELVDDPHHHRVNNAHTNVGAVDFTLREWAESFVDEDLGMTVGEVVDALQSDDIYRRHVLGGVLTNTLDPDPWVAMTDRGACDALADELSEARAVAARYPTVADAKAAGYTLGDWYNAGLGVHYQNWNHLGGFEQGRPVQLLFDGADDDSSLVGVSYVVSAPGDVPPEGFTGDNDRWHRHRSFCLDAENGGVNLSSDVLSVDECGDLGGSFVPNADLWMLHTWVRPGCESDWGIFSSANPRLPYKPDGVRFGSGCNSGKLGADSLDLDESGSGPDIN